MIVGWEYLLYGGRMKLTWGEFKRKVDAELNKANLNDTVDIQFIDITPYDSDDISINAMLFGLEIISYKGEKE